MDLEICEVLNCGEDTIGQICSNCNYVTNRCEAHSLWLKKIEPLCSNCDIWKEE